MDFRTALVLVNKVISENYASLDLNTQIALADAFVAHTNLSPHDALVQRALASTTVMDLMHEGKKIGAIKELRTISNAGLKEAKDAVEDHRVTDEVNRVKRLGDGWGWGSLDDEPPF